MVLDEEKAKMIGDTFKLIAQYKEDASNSTSAAGEAMKHLAEKLTGDSGEIKEVKESLTIAYKEFEKELKNKPDTLPDAIDIMNAIGLGKKEE